MSDVVLKFGATDDGLSTQFRKINQELEALERGANKTSALIGKGFSALAGVVGAVSLVRLTQEAFQLAEALEVSSARTGISIENIQKLQFVADQADVAVESITSSINKFQINLAQGSDKTVSALSRLGISITEINALQPDQQFLRIAEAIADISSPAERAATAVEIFGKQGTELLPFLTQGADGIRELDGLFDKFGVTLSADTVHKVDDAGDAIGRLGHATKGLGVELLSLVSGPLTAVADGVNLFLHAIRFHLKGEQGDNAITNLDRDIELLQRRIESLNNSNFLPLKQQTELTDLQHRLHDLLDTQRELLGLNASPIAKLGIDPEEFQLPKGVTKALNKIDLGPSDPTEQQKREGALGNNPVGDIEIEEKDFLVELNQEKLDELLRQEQEHAEKIKVIDGSMADFRASIRETFGTREISFEEAKNATLLDIGSGLFGALAKENTKYAKVQQGLALAETIWSTSAAITKALKEGGPWPANLIAAAKVGAMGAIQIAKIKATNYSAGSVSSGGAASLGGGGGSAAGGESIPSGRDAGLAQDQSAAYTTQIYINGFISHEVIQDLVDQLEDKFKRGAVIISGSTNQAHAIRQGA